MRRTTVAAAALLATALLTLCLTPATALALKNNRPSESLHEFFRRISYRPSIKPKRARRAHNLQDVHAAVLAQALKTARAPHGRAVRSSHASRQSLHTDTRVGLTGELCSSDTGCAGARKCGRDDQDCSTETCICIPVNASDLFCDCEDTCDTGERCVVINVSGGNSAGCVVSRLDFLSVRCPPRFTLDTCLVSVECQNPRICEERENDNLCSSGDCVCFPPTGLTRCDCNSPCDLGEVCRVFSDGAFCVTTALATNVLECSTNAPPNAAPTTSAPTTSPPTTFAATTTSSPSPASSSASSTTPSPNESGSTDDPTRGNGLTLQPCRSNDDCREPRQCEELESRDLCSSDECVCFPRNGFDRCDCDTRCSDGEVCGVFGDEGETVVCAAPAFVGNLLDCNNEACIDVRMLENFDDEDLVYQNHIVGRVLCDEVGSCATPGHMVHYQGSTMMMRNYCKLVPCTVQMMQVNSPKYRRGIRVPSKTDGLHFTAFAARYETRAEEAVMAAAVRMGL